VLAALPEGSLAEFVVPPIEGKFAPGLETLPALPDGAGARRGDTEDAGDASAGLCLTGGWGAAGASIGTGGVTGGDGGGGGALGSDGTGVAVTDSTAPATSPSEVAEARETPKANAIETTPATEIPRRRESAALPVEPLIRPRAMIRGNLTLVPDLILYPIFGQIYSLIR
jgi:hypothetical protein